VISAQILLRAHRARTIVVLLGDDGGGIPQRKIIVVLNGQSDATRVPLRPKVIGFVPIPYHLAGEAQGDHARPLCEPFKSISRGAANREYIVDNGRVASEPTPACNLLVTKCVD